MDFVDSNVWLYAIVEGQDQAKHQAAAALVSQAAHVVSTQVINEVCVNLIRKFAFDDANSPLMTRRLKSSFMRFSADAS